MRRRRRQAGPAATFEDESSGQTRLSTHAFTGTVALRLPDSIAFDVGVVTKPHDFIGATVPVVLAKK